MYKAELPVTPGAQWDTAAGTGVLQPPARPRSQSPPGASLHQRRVVLRCEMPVWSCGSWPSVTDFSFCCVLR